MNMGNSRQIAGAASFADYNKRSVRGPAASVIQAAAPHQRRGGWG